VKFDHVLVARSFGATPMQILWRVYVPSMMPVLLEALRISMIFNFTGVMIAEMYASRTGIGHLIANWGENFQMPELFSGVILLAAVAIAFNEAVRQSMREDGNVFCAGEDIGAFGGVFGTYAGLQKEFGEMRCIDTPISEHPGAPPAPATQPNRSDRPGNYARTQRRIRRWHQNQATATRPIRRTDLTRYARNSALGGTHLEQPVARSPRGYIQFLWRGREKCRAPRPATPRYRHSSKSKPEPARYVLRVDH
jgi:hypothetical protein